MRSHVVFAIVLAPSLAFAAGDDKNPKDPVNGWERTWAYLKDLNSCIEYYPTGTGIVMKELGEGTRDMTITMTGWYGLKTVPSSMSPKKKVFFQNKSIRKTGPIMNPTSSSNSPDPTSLQKFSIRTPSQLNERCGELR